MGKFKEIDNLAHRTKRTDHRQGAAAFLIRELRGGATIVDVAPRLSGEVRILLQNAEGFNYSVRLNLGELAPDQLEIYAKALAGKSVRGVGTPRINEQRDAWLRGTVALYWAQGHPLSVSATKISAFEMAAEAAAERDLDITIENVQKNWEKSSVKLDLENAVKGNLD